MAVLTVYRPPLAVALLGTITVHTSTQIQIVAGSITIDYFGSGITYSGTSVTGGIITRTTYNDSNNGGLQYEITGLSHPATMVAALSTGGNPEALTEFLLNGNDTIVGSPEADFLRGWAGADSISAGGGNDTLNGAWDPAVDTLRGGAGNDVYQVGGSIVDVLVELAGEGTDRVEAGSDFTLPDQIENLTLVGVIGARATGNSLANLLVGSNQNNTLDGGGGSDTLQGGTGNDTFIVDAGDVVSDAGGIDLIETDASGYQLGAAFEHLRLTGIAASATGNALANLMTGNAVANLLAAGDGNDSLLGNEGDDTLAGDAGNDSLLGGSGNDSVQGGEGNDSLQGGEGADTLAGGAGDDSYVFDSPTDVLVELAGGGNDTVQSAQSITLAAQIEVLVLTGSAAINGTGNAQANRITGTAAANVLDGGAGADTLEGGGGGDSYVVDDAGDTIVETGTSGTDTVFSSVNWSLGSNATVENLTLTGSAALTGTGNALANLITGNDGNNQLFASGAGDTLVGGLGSDSLFGTTAADRLDGGAGADSLSGGLGADIYTVDNPLDVVTEVVSTAAAELNDLVNSWISFALPEQVESLTLIGSTPINATAAGRGTLRGNSGANLLAGGKAMYGMDGNDTLDAAGADGTLVGGAGDDTYIVDSALVTLQEDASGGNDTIVNMQAVLETVLPSQFENLTLAAGTNGTGNFVANLIVGNAGANLLDGKQGADTLRGGLGNDVYYVDNAGDVVTELAGQGSDRIELVASIDYSLAGTAVETLYLSGTNTRGTGNELANTLRGSSGNNTLDGGAGADTLEGGQGDDSYVIDAADSIVEASFAGADTVRSGLASTTLAANLENLVLLAGALNGTGNAAANAITGNGSGNQLSGGDFGDTLRGMQGDDTLTGGSGNDNLDGDAGVDTAVFSGQRQGYTITSNNGSVTVTGADHTDVLVGVDRLSFDDQVVVLNANQASGQIFAAGLEIEGQALISAIGAVTDADGTGPLALQWFRDEVAVFGANASSYTLVAADVGHAMSLRARFVDGAGNTETLWSEAFDIVQPADKTAPTVTAFSPADEAKDVGLDSNLVLTFSEGVLRGTGFITLRSSAGTVIESFGVSSNRVSVFGNTVTVDPTASFAQSTGYRLEFPAGSLKDAWGNSYAGTLAYNFSTEDLAAPTVTAFSPVEGYDSFEVEADIVLRFSEAIARGAGDIVLRAMGGIVVETWSAATSGGLTLSGNTLTINPAADLSPAQAYTLEIPPGAILDLAGKSYAGASGYTFTTEHAGQNFAGATGNDSLLGTSGNDSLGGSGGSDTLAGNGGNDTVSGGDGIDTAVFAGPRSGYLLSRTAGGLGASYTVADQAASRDGADSVGSAEYLRFSDRNVDLGMGTKSQALSAANLKTLEELYVGFFNRIPEAAGLAYWIDQVGNKGLGLTQVANQFYDAGVAFGVYQASMNNAQFIQAVYANVLYRPAGSANAPTALEIDYWNQRLVKGEDTKGSMVLTMLSDVHRDFENDPVYGFVAASLNNKAAVANYYAVQQGLGYYTAQENIDFGIALAALITPTDTSAAIEFIGVNSFSLLG